MFFMFFICKLLFLSSMVQNSRPASGSGRRSAHTDGNVDTDESLLLSQEDKSQSHRAAREISREAGDPSIICFADYSQSSSATRKGALNS